MCQGGSGSFIGQYYPIASASEDWGIDFEAEVAVIVDDIPIGISVAATGRRIQLLLPVNYISLRSLIPGELRKGFSAFRAKPSSAFPPQP